MGGHEQIDEALRADSTFTHISFELFRGIHAEALSEIENLSYANFTDWTATEAGDEAVGGIKEGDVDFAAIAEKWT